MRKLWRAVPALFVGATLLVPVAPASAGWTCSYYRWDAPRKQWRTVAHAVPQDEFRSDHVLGVDYHCEYCYVPALESKDPDPFEDLDPIETAQSLIGTTQVPEVPKVPSLNEVSLSSLMTLVSSAEPLNGPKCPDVPPVWDAEELDPVVGSVIG